MTVAERCRPEGGRTACAANEGEAPGEGVRTAGDAGPRCALHGRQVAEGPVVDESDDGRLGRCPATGRIQSLHIDTSAASNVILRAIKDLEGAVQDDRGECVLGDHGMEDVRAEACDEAPRLLDVLDRQQRVVDAAPERCRKPPCCPHVVERSGAQQEADAHRPVGDADVSSRHNRWTVAEPTTAGLPRPLARSTRPRSQRPRPRAPASRREAHRSVPGPGPAVGRNDSVFARRAAQGRRRCARAERGVCSRVGCGSVRKRATVLSPRFGAPEARLHSSTSEVVVQVVREPPELGGMDSAWLRGLSGVREIVGAERPRFPEFARSGSTPTCFLGVSVHARARLRAGACVGRALSGTLAGGG